MMISPFSVLMALLWFTIAALIGSFILRRAEKYGLVLVSIIYFLALLRCVLPLDFSESVVIRLEKIYPMLRDLFSVQIYGSITVSGCLLALWGIGAVIRLFQLFLKLIWQVKFLHGVPYEAPDSEVFSLLDKVCDELGYHGRFKLTTSSRPSTANQAGFLKPHILLSADMSSFQKQDICNIFRHEMCHFLGGDLWIKMGVQMMSCLLWWNPVVPLLNRSITQLLELRCDKRACKGLSSAEQLGYLDSLLRFIKGAEMESSHLALSYLGNLQDSEITQRFLLVLQDRPLIGARSRFQFWGSCVICLTMFLASYAVILQPGGFPPPVEDGHAITAWTPENAYILQRQDGTLVVYYNGIAYDAPVTEDMLDAEPFSSLPLILERKDER